MTIMIISLRNGLRKAKQRTSDFETDTPEFIDEYDAVGNLIRHIDANGNETNISV